jgi:nitrogen regulatory protein P-II 1
MFMKKIEAIIRPEKFDIIKDALTEQGFSGMSVTEMKGHGNQKGVSEVWRGKRYRVDLLPKIKMELIVNDDVVDKLVQTIISESQTGSIGDGKIFVTELVNVYRIRTGEEGEAAV